MPEAASVLWDQPLSAVNQNAYVNQAFPDFPSFDSYLSDDFTNAAPWLVRNIFVPGGGWNGFTSLLSASSLTWAIYADAGGVPSGYPGGGGAPFWTLTLAPTDGQVQINTGTPGGLPSNALLALNSPVALPPGTWWVFFYPTMGFGCCGQYGRQPSDTANGAVGQFVNPGGGFGLGTGLQSWGVLGVAQHDIAFRLEGCTATYPVPDILYYGFNEAGGTTTADLAIPGAGTNPAPFTGHSMAPIGQWGSSLVSSGVSGDHVDSGYSVAMGTGDWTVSLWLNAIPVGDGMARYLFGDGTSSFRAFLDGAAGVGNVLLRGPINDVLVTGVSPGPTVLQFVYDHTVPEIRAYKNGVLVATVAQSALNITGGSLWVGGYSGVPSQPPLAGTRIDEFRLYGRALSATEIADTWGEHLPIYCGCAGATLSSTYDNGPLVTHPGGGAGGADASALQTALGMGTYGYGHAVSSGYRVADSFVVDDPVGWDISTIEFYAYQTGSGTTSTINAVNYRIWNGDPSNPASGVVFGDTTTNRLTGSTWSNIYRVLDTGLTDTNRPIMVDTVSCGVHLAPGTYWLDWQTGGSLGSGPWAPPVTILGLTNTGNGLQWNPGTSTWGPLVDVGTQGMPFKVNYAVCLNCPVITLSPVPLPTPIFGVPYSQAITAAGGTGPYTFAVTAGSLPTGLTLSAAGLLSGTMTALTPTSFTITATDTASGCTGEQAYTLSTFSAFFKDDYGRSQMCVNRLTGAYTFQVLVGPGAGVYTGTCVVMNGGAKYVNQIGASAKLNVTYDAIRKKASGYYITAAGVYMALSDANTANNTGGCP